MTHTTLTYYESIYKLYISALIEESSDKQRKIAEKIIGEPLDMEFNTEAKTIEYTNTQGAQRILMLFKYKKKSLLVHELVHVFEYCFSSRRIKFDLNNSEIMAYYLEHLFTKFEPLFN